MTSMNLSRAVFRLLPSPSVLFTLCVAEELVVRADAAKVAGRELLDGGSSSVSNDSSPLAPPPRPDDLADVADLSSLAG